MTQIGIYMGWLRDWVKDNPRRGYRMAWAGFRAEGVVVNRKKVQRLWREEGLKVPLRRRRKRVGKSTSPQVKTDAPNMVWAVDFQFDAIEARHTIKVCSIVDECTGECIGGMVERSITAEKLRQYLDFACLERGAYPAVVRSDNGSEFIS